MLKHLEIPTLSLFLSNPREMQTYIEESPQLFHIYIYFLVFLFSLIKVLQMFLTVVGFAVSLSLPSLPLFQISFLIHILMPLILPQAFTPPCLYSFRLFPLLGMSFLPSLQLGKLLFLFQDTSREDGLPLGTSLWPPGICRVVQNINLRELGEFR